MNAVLFADLIASVKQAGAIRRGEMCEWCNARPATEKHHCLFHRMKGKPELDDPRNIMNVCHDCHMSGEVNGHEARRRFWQRQCKRYGEDDMRRWVESLPLKVKEKFD